MPSEIFSIRKKHEICYESHPIFIVHGKSSEYRLYGRILGTHINITSDVGRSLYIELLLSRRSIAALVLFNIIKVRRGRRRHITFPRVKNVAQSMFMVMMR